MIAGLVQGGVELPPRLRSGLRQPDSPFGFAQGGRGRLSPHEYFQVKWIFLCPLDRIFRRKVTNRKSIYRQRKEEVPKYVIERDIPNAGSLTQDQILGISQKSCSVLKNLGPQIQWVESYVTQDKIYCVYIAPNEAIVREHAKQGGFPANRVSEVKRIIDPTSAER
jgi:hypothetical protein